MSPKFLSFVLLALSSISQNLLAQDAAKDVEADHLKQLNAALLQIETIHTAVDIRGASQKKMEEAIRVFTDKDMVPPPAADANEAAKSSYKADQDQKLDALKVMDTVAVKVLGENLGALKEIQLQYAKTPVGVVANRLVIKALAANTLRDPVAGPKTPTPDETKSMKASLAAIEGSKAFCPAPAKLAKWRGELTDSKKTYESHLQFNFLKTRELDAELPKLAANKATLEEKQSAVVGKLKQVEGIESKLRTSLVNLLRELVTIWPYEKGGDKIKDKKLKAAVEEKLYRAFADQLIDGSYKLAFPEGVKTFADVASAKEKDALRYFAELRHEPDVDRYYGLTPEGTKIFSKLIGLDDKAAIILTPAQVAEMAPSHPAAKLKADQHLHIFASPHVVAVGRIKELDKIVAGIAKSGLHDLYAEKKKVEDELVKATTAHQAAVDARTQIRDTIEMPLAQAEALLAQLDKCSDTITAREKAVLGVPHAPFDRTSIPKLEVAEKAAVEAKSHSEALIKAIRRRNRGE